MANHEYWDHPRPYLDQFEIISIDDDSARVNALAAGQVDIASPVPAVQAKANQPASGSGWKTVVSAPGVPQMFVMRIDRTPFTDNRVRLAMKLIANRPGLIEAAFSGYGVVGNDLVGRGLEYYDSNLPQRQQDIEQAKSLLTSAGQSNLRVTLQTSNVGAGVVEAATALAQQASAAGVNIHVQQEPSSAYFNTSLLYTKMTFCQSYWTGILALPQFYDQALTAGAIFPETHWSDPAFTALLTKAEGTVDHSQAQALWNQVQEIQYNKGGYLIWGIQEVTHGIGPRVAGFGGPGTGWTGYADDFRVYNWGVAA